MTRLAALAVLLCASTQENVVEVTVDGGRVHQRIDGFGVNALATLRIALSNLAAPERLEIYQTTASADLQRGTDVEVTGCKLTAAIAADCIFTLTGPAGPPKRR